MDYKRNAILGVQGRLYMYALAMIGVFVSLFLFFSIYEEQRLDVSPEKVQAAEVSYEQKEWVPEPPARLLIPAIAVDAHIQYVGLDPKGTGEMDIPSNFTDVGWYQPGVQPGMQGSAVIAGHYNGKDISKAVFFDLDALQAGDEVIVVSAKQTRTIFQVIKIETYDYDAPATEVFESYDEKKRLNLITCDGIWLPEEKRYDKRTVVFTELLTGGE